MIVPAFTWVSTANVVLYCGATPVFIDVERTRPSLDVSQIAGKLSPGPKPFCHCPSLRLLCRYRMPYPGSTSRSTHLRFEDAACASGSFLQTVRPGSLGVAAAFSFHPRKSITTGEGGMITTAQTAFSRSGLKLSDHGASIRRNNATMVHDRSPSRFQSIGLRIIV